MYGILPAYISMFHILAWWPQRPEQGSRSPGGGVKDGCELPWMLGIESRSSGRAISTLRWWATFSIFASLVLLWNALCFILVSFQPWLPQRALYFLGYLGFIVAKYITHPSPIYPIHLLNFSYRTSKHCLILLSSVIEKLSFLGF